MDTNNHFKLPPTKVMFLYWFYKFRKEFHIDKLLHIKTRIIPIELHRLYSHYDQRLLVMLGNLPVKVGKI